MTEISKAIMVPVLTAGMLCVSGFAMAAHSSEPILVAQANQGDANGKGDLTRDRDRLRDQSCRDDVDKARQLLDKASKDCGPDRDRDRDRDKTRDRKNK